MTLFEKIRQGVSNVEVMTLPSGHDVNSFFVANGVDGILGLVRESYDGSTEDVVLDDEGEAHDGVDGPEPEADGAGSQFGPAGVAHYDAAGEVIPF